jgi:hypothetical protein
MDALISVARVVLLLMLTVIVVSLVIAVAKITDWAVRLRSHVAR